MWMRKAMAWITVSPGLYPFAVRMHHDFSLRPDMSRSGRRGERSGDAAEEGGCQGDRRARSLRGNGLEVIGTLGALDFVCFPTSVS